MCLLGTAVALVHCECDCSVVGTCTCITRGIFCKQDWVRVRTLVGCVLGYPIWCMSLDAQLIGKVAQ